MSHTTDSAVTGHLNTSISALFAATSQKDVFQSMCHLGRESTGAVGVAILSRHQGNVGIIAASPALKEHAPQGTQHSAEEKPEWLLSLAKPFGQSFANTIQTIRLESHAQSAYGLYIPLLSSEQGSLFLAACILGARSVRLQSSIDMLQLVKTSLLLLDKMQNSEHNSQNQDSSEKETYLLSVIDTMSELQKSTRFFEAASTLCASLAATFECRRVALGMTHKGQVKLVAIDQMENFSRGTRSVRLLEEAMQEAYDQASPLLYQQHTEAEQEQSPAPKDAPEQAATQEQVHSTIDNISAQSPLVTRATAELAVFTNVRHILTIPLPSHQEKSFILLFQKENSAITSQQMSALHLVGNLAAPSLYQLYLAEESPFKKLWRYIAILSEDIFGPRRTMLKLATLIMAILLTISMTVSSHLVVSASMVIEGVHSYTHTAPMDSYLTEVYVRPGDEINVGDILGRLDSTEITLEIAALEAQKNIYESQASQHLQEGRNAEATIAEQEAARTAANLRWAQQRLAMTELTSNVQGFLVSEDMLPRLGQPVQRGQALFEITDTASLRLVAHVSEEDISDITHAIGERGKPEAVQGEFTLTAYPDMQIPFHVERVHPYATVMEEKNGFEVRGRTTHVPQGLVLRPGMEGHAKITVGERPWLVLLLRKLINKVRMLWWRWI